MRWPAYRHTVLSEVAEIRARGARTIVIAKEGVAYVRPYAHHLIDVPRTQTLFAPLVSMVPLRAAGCRQLLPVSVAGPGRRSTTPGRTSTAPPWQRLDAGRASRG